MNTKSIIFALIALVIIVGVFFFLQQDKVQAPTDTQNNAAVNPPPPPPSNVVEILVNTAETDFAPETTRVMEGQEVVLKVSSPIADEVHLHGYDLSKDLEAGEQGEIRFVANKTGRFEFELEEHKILLGAIEVYPK